MKKILFALAICYSIIAVSQNKQVLYNWDVSPQSLLLNPGAVVDQKHHYGIPFLSGFHINGGTSGVTVFDIFSDDGRDINDKIAEALTALDSNDFFTATQQLELINFGWRSKSDYYFSGGIYQEFDFISYLPKDFLDLAREGNRDYIGRAYNFDHISLRADLLTVYHFGFNKKVTDKLTLGLRFKAYSSMISASSTGNTGTFTTTQNDGTPNIYEHTVEGLNVEVKTSGYASLKDVDGSSQIVSDVLGRAFFGGNLGLGFDFGATYEITNQLSATASILDIGTIFHSSATEIYNASGNYTLDGLELLFPTIENGETTFPYYSDLEDEIEREIPVDTLNSAYSQMRPAKINAGLHYDFGESIGRKSGDCDCRNMGGKSQHVSQAGIQYYSVFRPKGIQAAGTVYYRRRFSNWLSTKATYTVDSYSASNIGLGMALNIGSLNFHLAADNLLDIANIAKANSLSLQFGFNIIVEEL
ncbi:hypothetical protein ULMA_28460 [Patiriisocius marinus]|uniref:DUF5723 domain-containing protein n=1 Tax=Patiriisocius marinus TaxID=1397112 RepID=A0A5J4J3X9_9FLAO|nr:DUF5723 family protein [Patiriisocius marinus]GER60738.1 hypothetical protein ULMA_28460 [Patiriisocius marinus]